MKKCLLLSLFSAFISTQLFAAPHSKLQGFDFFELGMPYSALVDKKAACDAPKDIPSFRDSAKQGVTSTVCPTTETFAMATLLNDRVASIAVNWVSWDLKKLMDASPTVASVTAKLRKQYGIPASTVAYEAAFGNKEADALCKSGDFVCQMHIWKGRTPDRVATLIYAKGKKGELPLLFNLSDLTAESEIEKIKNGRLQADDNSPQKSTNVSH